MTARQEFTRSSTQPASPERWFEGFDAREFAVNGTSVFARFGGNTLGPTLVLLHGFPQSHGLWHRVAQDLQNHYFLVLPDLRGYGDSAKPVGLPDHSNYSKRTMAQDVIGVVDALDRDNFYLCGHDRGARVSHRLALDHPARVDKLCVIDIAPTLDMYDATDMAFATAYYHWFHLIQPAPLPENMIAGVALAYLHAFLGGLGTGGLDYLEPAALLEYERSFTPETIHAACEDYRASAGIDLDHDRASRACGERIRCDVEVLCGERGVVNRLFRPQELWQAQCAGTVSAKTMPAGHFIPEELPHETAHALRQFFGDVAPGE